MYDIYMNGTSIGQAEVNREGLYYRFSCTCNLQNEGIHRIYVSDGVEMQNLGVCVPVGTHFYLSTRVPIKQFKGDYLSFEAVLGRKSDISASVQENVPFAYLDQLDTAYLQDANGQLEIVIDSVQDRPDNGQNPEYPHKWESP